MPTALVDDGTLDFNSQPSSPIIAPDNGEPVIAAGAPFPAPVTAGEVRRGFQGLANRTRWLYLKIRGLITGTLSVASMIVDGTGDQAVAAIPGSVRVSRLVSGTEGGGMAPLTTTVVRGEIPRGLVPVGWAKVNSDGTLARGVNIYDTSRAGAGSYGVVMNVGADVSGTAYCAVATTTSGQIFASVITTVTVGGRLTMDISTFNAVTNAAADTSFMIVVFAE